MQRSRFWPFGNKDELSCTEVRKLASELIDAEETLSPGLRERLLQHLDDCSDCSSFVSTLRATIETLYKMPLETAPDDLIEKLRRIAEDNP